MKHWLLALPFLITDVAFAKDLVYFADACSDAETKVETPNGVKLLVELRDLTPGEGVEVTVKFKPALPAEILKPQDKLIWKFHYGANSEDWLGRNLSHVDQNGKLRARISLPKDKWMKSVEARHNNYRIWDAEVSWYQEGSRKSGTKTTSFYHSPQRGPYFQVLSRSICYREGKAEVTSKLFENLTPHQMTVKQRTDLLWDQYSTRGLTLGYNNFEGNTQPLAQFGDATVFSGWLFRFWEEQIGTNEISTLESQYTLGPNEAGVFVTRMSFSRHRVRRFEWVKKSGGCGSFEHVSTGLLDVGRKTRGSFVVVPVEYGGRGQELHDFVNRAVPSVNTCTDRNMGPFEGPADDVLSSGREGTLLYFKL